MSAEVKLANESDWELQSLVLGAGGPLLTGLHLGREPDPPCQQSCAYGPISELALLLRPLYVLEASAVLLRSLLPSALHIQWTVPEVGIFWWPPLRVEKISFGPLTLFTFGADNHSSKSKVSSVFLAIWTVTYLFTRLQLRFLACLLCTVYLPFL